MAKFVIAGKSDCPFYARVELLADELQQRLPAFSVHKITLRPEQWNTWLDTTCKEKGWDYSGGSPIIWRELINRGGKGTLVGGSNEFLEIAKGYYGLTIDKMTDELKLISGENKKFKVSFDIQEQKRKACAKPYKITVTDSDTELAYSLLPNLCNGQLPNIKDIYLTLYSSRYDEQVDTLRGVSMELFDCANKELTQVSIEKDAACAFTDADLVIILNCQEIDSERVKVLKEYGAALNGHVKFNTKIIVAGEQPMIACSLISQAADKVSNENFYALSRFQENRIKSAIAKKLSVITPDISNIIVWGSSQKFLVEHSSATVSRYDGAVWAPHIENFAHDVNEMIYDREWLETELSTLLNQDKSDNNSEQTNFELSTLLNQEEPDNNCQKTNLSQSAALISQIQDVIKGSRNDLFSLGMVSGGWYGVPEGLVFSFPVFCNYGKLTVKENLVLDGDMSSRIEEIALNLKEYCDELANS